MKRRNYDYDPWGIVPPGRNKRKKAFAPWEDFVNRVDPSVPSAEEEKAASDWVLIHPTPRTRLFKEILLGEFGYTEGQGVYNSVRSTETAIRQVQSTILNNTLDAVRYDDLRGDWEEHAAARGMDPASVAVTYGAHSEGEAVRVAERVFETWRSTLQTALLDLVRGAAARFSSGEPDSASSFSKYIDWICCLGMVPMLRGKRKKDDDKATSEGSRQSRASYRGYGYSAYAAASSSSSSSSSTVGDNMEVARSVLARGRQIAAELTDRVESVTIMEYDRALIEYNFSKRRVRAKDAVTGEKGECIVIWRPVMRDGGVIFDSPLQRLYGEVMACHSLRRHVDVCRVVNTAPVKVILGKRSEDERGAAGARNVVERALGETGSGSSAEAAAGSAAARLVRLIINMKGMKHVGDITETVRDYLEETGAHLLDPTAPVSIDTSQAGFGKTNKAGSGKSGPGGSIGFPSSDGGRSGVRDAFQTSVVSSINGMLEGYINKLFGSLENLEAANAELSARVKRKDAEIWRLRKTALEAKQSEADARAEVRARSHYGVTDGILDDDKAARYLAEMGRDVIDVSGEMGDETYVANSFQSRYVPAYEADLQRLSSLWEQELIRCFKMTRLTNNQGQETSVSYSNSAITLLVAPYFYSILRVENLGVLVTNQEAYRSEEELCVGVFQKSRLETYLQDLGAVFVADVKRAVALAAAEPALAPESSDPRDLVPSPSWEPSVDRIGNSDAYYDSYYNSYDAVGEREERPRLPPGRRKRQSYIRGTVGRRRGEERESAAASVVSDPRRKIELLRRRLYGHSGASGGRPRRRSWSVFLEDRFADRRVEEERYGGRRVRDGRR